MFRKVTLPQPAPVTFSTFHLVEGHSQHPIEFISAPQVKKLWYSGYDIGRGYSGSGCGNEEDERVIIK